MHKDDIMSPASDVGIGSVTQVQIGKKAFPGKIAAFGKYSVCACLLQYIQSTKFKVTL